jgi:tetratricopeptide (TPR) repeat protein
MKKDDIPFNMEYSIDLSLREKAQDEGAMRQGVKFLKEKLSEETDDFSAATLLSMIGTYQRILIELSESEDAFKEAIEKYKKSGKKAHALGAKLRLAVTYQWKKGFVEADKIFVETIVKLENTEETKLQHYLDFAHQHYGKSLFEQYRNEVALDNFVAALELRLAFGDMKLIEDTQNCIVKTKEAIAYREKELLVDEE